MGLKAPDSSVVPLCRGCHLWIDGHTSMPPTKTERAAFSELWVNKTKLAATPDGYDHALELQGLGLGEVEHVKFGDSITWTWKGLVTP
jgi:hypothetical protein